MVRGWASLGAARSQWPPEVSTGYRARGIERSADHLHRKWWRGHFDPIFHELQEGTTVSASEDPPGKRTVDVDVHAIANARRVE
jgi:hypothetical protein